MMKLPTTSLRPFHRLCVVPSQTARFSSSVQLTKMLLLSEQNVKDCLPVKDCLEVNRKALMAVASQDAQVPTRLGLEYHHPHRHEPDKDQSSSSEALESPSAEPAADWTLFKPAAYTDPTKRHTANMGLKLVSIRANNPGQYNLPLVPATILSVHPETGLVRAIVAATYLTAARTAAGSALSTLLVKSPRQIRHVTVFGAGLQAKMHVFALYTAFREAQQQDASADTAAGPIPHVTIVNRTIASAETLANEITSQGWAASTKAVALDDALGVAESLSQTSVIYTCTNTTTPLFGNTMVPPGTHIAGVGSYTPEMQEVAADVVNRCRIFLDTPEAAKVGDLRHVLSLSNPQQQQQQPVTLLGTALASPHADESTWFAEETTTAEAPPSLDLQRYDCTFFKSVGTAIQDVLTADLVVQTAQQRGIGTQVDMS